MADMPFSSSQLLDPSPLVRTTPTPAAVWKSLVARIDPVFIILPALPVLLLLLYPDWIFNRWNNCDPWIYTGYFLDYPRHIRVSDTGYFGTRLSVILPGYLVYRCFRPLLANAVLHLLLYNVSVFSLYATLKGFFGRRAAFLTSILMGCHAFFLWEIGWDYVDSFGIAYYLLASWTTSLAARGGRWTACLAAAGACAAALVYANLFYVVYLPLLAIQYLFLCRQRNWRTLAAAGGFGVLGALALTMVLGAVHACLGGRFWFYWPSVAWAYHAMQRPNVYKSATYGWLKQATWLVLPAIVLAGGFFWLLFRARRTRGDRRAAIFFQLNLLAACLGLVFMQARGKPVLEYWYECSLLVPIAFLAAGPQLAGLVGCGHQRRFAAVIGLAVLLSLAPYMLPLVGRFLGGLHGWLPVRGPAVGSIYPGGIERIARLRMMLLPGLAGLAGFLLLLRRRPHLVVTALALGLLSFSNFASAQVGFFEPLIKDIAPQTKGANPDVFRSVARSLQAVQTLDPGGKVYFSFECDEPHFAVFHDIALAALWLGNLEPHKFPFTRTGSCLLHVKPAAHDKLVILSSDPAALEHTQAALRQAGLDGWLLGQRPVALATVHYTMSFVEILAYQPEAPTRE
jgi:hypothetical protein